MYRPPFTSDEAFKFAEALSLHQNLGVRACNALMLLDVKSVDELLALDEERLRRTKGVGGRTANEILTVQRALSPEGRLESKLREINMLLGQAMFSIERNPDIALEIRWINGMVPMVQAVANDPQRHTYPAYSAHLSAPDVESPLEDSTPELQDS